jgi:hypothetical protein
MEDGFTLNANVLRDAADLAKGLGNLVSQFEPPRVLSLPIQQLHPAGLDNEIGLCRSNLRPGGIAIHRVRERAALQPAQVLWRDQASFAERQNLTISMSMRRFTRLTGAFPKKSENHGHALALYFVWSGESPCRSRALQKERRNLKLRHYQIFARRALRC